MVLCVMEKIKTATVIKFAPAMIITVFLLTGCVTLLEDDVEHITRHEVAPFVREPVEQVTVSDYDEFFTAILEIIREYETESHLLYFFREGVDIQAEIQRARDEIINEHPLGAFAIADISANATRILAHYEVSIEIEYKRTKEQIDSIINALSERAISAHLVNIMSQYNEAATFRSRLQLDEETISDLVRETYYQNPRLIVMLPVVVVGFYPETGTERIYEIQFNYAETARMLQRFGELLNIYVQQNAERAVGSTDSEVVLSLVENFIGSTVFDEQAARNIHSHGAQNLSATAYGALVRESAVGEGFAMAFKALADESGISCRVVLGYLDGMVHAWNIVYLYGDYYHIDVAMSAVNGIETAFLKTDDDFEEMLYSWDIENTVRCEGELTLEDIQGDEEPDDTDDDQTDEQNNEEDYLHARRKRIL